MNERPVVQKILYPVDLSPFCASMTEYVKGAAAMFGAQVALAYVCDLESHNGFELYVRCPQEIAEEHFQLARRRLRKFMLDEFPSSERILSFGDPAEQIVDLACKGRFDLIVMPTHGGVFRRMLLGSVTAKVLNDAACPVLTTEHAPVPRPIQHRHWVCAVGVSGDSARVVRIAATAARQVSASLSLVHVLSNDTPAENAHCALNEMLASIGGCKADVCVVRGEPKEALIKTAQECSGDMLIVGRPCRGYGHIRDLSYGLIRDSPVPVLSV